MASKPRKLKVFQARLGFYDTVVAAPSQAAALRAWGAHGNLFADGVAAPASDEAAIEAALAQPEIVLKRAIGTAEPFGLNPGLPRLPDEPARARTAPTRSGSPAKPAGPRQSAVKSAPAPKPPPDRRALDAAEAKLEEIKRERARGEAELRARREALDREEEEAHERWTAEARQAEAARRVAHERYVEAGGR